jgi:GNAT superfamily N-acetyltransferase
MSSIAHRALPFDFNSFPIGRQALLQDWREYNAKAFLAVESRMAIGYLVTRLVSKWGTVCLDDTGRTVPIKNYEMRRPRIDLIFVCSNHRQQGIGTKLVLAAAENHGITPQEMVWQSPLEEAAFPLARKLSNKGMLYVT